MKKLDKIVAVSRATAEECRKRGASEENIAVIPNGVDKDMRNIRKDPLFKERLAEPSKLKKTAESFQLYTLQNCSWEKMTEAYRQLFSLLLHSKKNRSNLFRRSNKS
jgi:hypothetical protein